MNLPRLLCLHLAAIAIGTIASSAPAQSPNSAQSPSSAQSSKLVQSPVPTQQSLGAYSYEGFARAIEDVMLGSEEMGLITAMHVRVGQAIQAGQVIAQLDDSLEKAAVNVSRVQAEMMGEIDAAKANSQLAQLKTEQYESLAKKSMASAAELRQARLENQLAAARLQSALDQRSLKQAELARLELQLEKRKVLAPFDGLVADIYLHKGATITPTNPTLLRLIRIDVLHAVFNVPAEHAPEMQTGMATQVYFRAARQTVNGKIEAISPAIDGESGTVQIWVRVENPTQSLRPGDRCTMRLTPDQNWQSPDAPSGTPRVSRRER